MKLGPVTITSGNTPFDYGPDRRTKWTERQIRGSEKKSVVGSWLGLSIPLFILGFFHWFAHMPLSLYLPGTKGHLINPIMAIVGVITALILIKAIWETVRLNRFGDPTLELNTAPIPLGGTVEGRIPVPFATTSSPDFIVRLACVRQYQQQGGKDSHTVETVLWKDERTAKVLVGGILPIAMAVPVDQPHTNGANPFDRILWRVTVKAPFGLQKFVENYEVPVGSAPADPMAI